MELSVERPTDGRGLPRTVSPQCFGGSGYSTYSAVRPAIGSHFFRIGLQELTAQGRPGEISKKVGSWRPLDAERSGFGPVNFLGYSENPSREFGDIAILLTAVGRRHCQEEITQKLAILAILTSTRPQTRAGRPSDAHNSARRFCRSARLTGLTRWPSQPASRDWARSLS